MTAFAHHTWIELRSSLRNRQLLFLTFAFPLAFYALMGLIMTQINPMFTDTMIPAMVIFAVMIATLLGLPDPLVTARDAGIFRSYKIHGVPALNALAAPTVTTFLHLAIVAAIILMTATPLFAAPAPLSWGWFLVVTGAATLAHVGLGVLIGVVSSSSRATLLWSQLIFLPSMLVGGLMIPLGLLPAQAQTLARLLPATHAMNAYNGLSARLRPWRSCCWAGCWPLGWLCCSSTGTVRTVRRGCIRPLGCWPCCRTSRQSCSCSRAIAEHCVGGDCSCSRMLPPSRLQHS